ncbi:MAG: serine/threonine-protein kinase [Isosphaeraceae bacterium]|nr:serine/threonine-protein kinase [Isosphaeraceae bacterium]
MEVVLRVTLGPHAGDERLLHGAQTFIIGRSPQVEVPMPDDRLLSREHFRIDLDPPLCTLVDLKSTNGTKVNGLRVECVPLRNDDVIAAGDSTFVVRLNDTRTEKAAEARCPGCGRPAPNPPAPELEGLCTDCAARRRRFPKTDPAYLIERMIGGGGMGEVYLAKHLTTHRPVAIKMMPSTRGATERGRNYFRREMQVLKDLLMPNGECHPNIVAFYDILEVDRQFQLIMEYVAGKNALEWLGSLPAVEGPTDRSDTVVAPASKSRDDALPLLPLASALRIGWQLLSALAYAHGKGYVHRDVKPSNLLVMGPVHRPKVKLSDFGLAKSFRENSEFTQLTGQGVIGGSVGFLSPDHIRDFRDLRASADLYCAGVTLYYLLTLNYPYLGFNPQDAEAYTMILENPPVPLRVYRPDAPPSLERILRKALEKHPEARWESASAMAQALRKLAPGAPG